MALTEYTIKITNTLSNPTVLGGGKLDLTVISPTGITTPQTPYVEYISDMLTVTPGVLSIPLYKREQFFNLPAASVLTIMTDDGQEALYYENLEIEGAVVTVTSAPVQIVLAVPDGTTAVGTNKTLTATGAGASAITGVVSSDTGVATVSNSGATITVVPVAAGKTTITATTTYDGATFTASCEFTVTAS